VSAKPNTLAIALALALGAGGAGGSAAQEPGHERLDADLRQALEDTGNDIPLFVLLEEQSGLDERSWRRETEFRKETWRRSVIDELQTLAGRSQDALLDELAAAGHRSPETHRFWIVNGLGLKLDRPGIEWLGRSPRVARVYLRTEKPDDLIATEGKYTRSFEQPAGKALTIDDVLAHEELSWNLTSIQADQVWSRLGLLGRGVVVGIMDSGVNYRHSDFRYHLWRNEGEVERNLEDDDGNGYVDDIYGFNFANGNGNIEDDFFHGNSSASVMVGDGRGGMLTGIAPGARLMTLRMYDQRTRHDNRILWQAFQYDAFEALQYAVAEGAHVINMSFSWEPAEKPLDAAWRHAATNAVAAGVVMVAGTGNWRGAYSVPRQILPPANVPAVIATGGLMKDGSLPPLSSRGPVTWSGVPPFDDYPLPEGVAGVVALSAPWGNFPTVHFRLRGYEVLGNQAGSSLTSPHVAGVVALLLEHEPELMPDQIRERLIRSSLDIGEIGTDPYTGAGLVQAYDAIMLGSVPLPRLTAIRFRQPGTGETSAGLLHPGSRVVVELDVENPGAPDRGTELELLAAGEAVSIPRPRQRLEALGQRQTVSFTVDVTAEAEPGSRVPLTLVVNLGTAGRRELKFELPVWGSRVLLVDDDGGGFYETEWTKSLERLGVPFDLLSHWPEPRARLPDLSRYETVVWIKGEEAYRTLSETEERLLSRFLESGRLILAGQNLARDLDGRDFLNRLGVRFVQDRVRPGRLAGVPGSLLDGIDVAFSTGATLPDAIAATGAGELLLPVEEPAGSGVAVGTEQSVVITVEIGGVGSNADRDLLVSRLLGGA